MGSTKLPKNRYREEAPVLLPVRGDGRLPTDSSEEPSFLAQVNVPLRRHTAVGHGVPKAVRAKLRGGRKAMVSVQLRRPKWPQRFAQFLGDKRGNHVPTVTSQAGNGLLAPGHEFLVVRSRAPVLKFERQLVLGQGF